MRTFLDLPKALRNVVYDYVIFSPVPRPSTPEDCQFSHYAMAIPFGTCFGYKCVHYPPPYISIPIVLLRNPQINITSETTEILDNLIPQNLLFYHITSSGLLLANRQIHFEIREIFDSLIRYNNVVYKFDCIIMNQGALFATPLLIPVKTSSVATMEIDIRFCGEYNLQRGCAPLWKCSLLALLNVVLKHGPHFPKLTEGSSGAKLKVGAIVLNFLSVPKVPEWMISSQMLVKPAEIIHENQEMGLRMVEREIDKLLNPKVDWHLQEENKILHERVGCIQFMDNGKLRREWDLRAINS